MHAISTPATSDIPQLHRFVAEAVLLLLLQSIGVRVCRLLTCRVCSTSGFVNMKSNAKLHNLGN